MKDLVAEMDKKVTRDMLAESVGLTVSSLERLIHKDPEFPKPINNTPRNPIYRKGDVIRYLAQRKKDKQ